MMEFYDNVYSQNPAKWSGTARDETAFLALSEFGVPKSLLDIGCGNGHTLDYFHKRWPETVYYGIDLSSVALKLASKKLPTGTFLQGSADEIELPKTDMTILLGTLEHIESHSILSRLSGIIYVEVPNCLSYSSSKDEGFRKTTGAGRTGQTEWHLKRETWEGVIFENGRTILRSYVGKNEAWEFIWVLA